MNMYRMLKFKMLERMVWSVIKIIPFPKKLQNLPLAPIGISTATCHSHVPFLLCSLYSLYFYTKQRFPVYIVNDGTLTQGDYRLLTTRLPCIIDDVSTREKRLKKNVVPFPVFISLPILSRHICS